MKRNSPRLENIVNGSSREHHINDHPHEHIASHIAGIMFLSLLFLFSVGMFFVAEPGETTAYAVVDFSEMDLGIGDKAGEFFGTIMKPELREELMLIAYVTWILIVGAVNLFLVEREFKHHGK
ncbi:MAG: hypothetical protein ACOCZ6_02680 [Nanoarchaeota archaeon]